MVLLLSCLAKKRTYIHIWRLAMMAMTTNTTMMMIKSFFSLFLFFILFPLHSLPCSPFYKYNGKRNIPVAWKRAGVFSTKHSRAFSCNKEGCEKLVSLLNTPAFSHFPWVSTSVDCAQRECRFQPEQPQQRQRNFLQRRKRKKKKKRYPLIFFLSSLKKKTLQSRHSVFFNTLCLCVHN